MRILVLVAAIWATGVCGCESGDSGGRKAAEENAARGRNLASVFLATSLNLDWVPGTDAPFVEISSKGDMVLKHPKLLHDKRAGARDAMYSWAQGVLAYYQARHGFDVLVHKFEHTDCPQESRHGDAAMWVCKSYFTITNGTTPGAAKWETLRDDLNNMDLLIVGPVGGPDGGVYGLKMTVFNKHYFEQ